MLVTMLSILGNRAVAVPLAPGFPASELRYVMNNSTAVLLLSSTRFLSKGKEALAEGLGSKSRLKVVEKRFESLEDELQQTPVLVNSKETNIGGLMLYTSGTTSRPVWT